MQIHKSLKVAVTGCLLITVFFLVRQEIGSFKYSNDKVKIRQLSQLMPRSYDEFSYSVRNNLEIDLRVLAAHIKYYKKVVEVFPDIMPEGYSMLGYCYYRAGDTDKAIENYSRADALVPGNVIFGYNLGCLLYQKGMLEDAVRTLKRAAQSDIDKTFIFINRSMTIYPPIIRAMVSQGYGSFIQEQIRSAYKDIFKLLVVSALKTQRYDLVKDVAFTARKYDAENSWYYLYYYGMAEQQMHNYNSSIAAFKQSLDLMPTNAGAYTAMSLSLRDMGKGDLALQFLLQAKSMEKLQNPVESLEKGLRLYCF